MDWFGARHDQGGAAPMDLIGREPEIQQLQLFVSRITKGAGDALLLSGDPGVGKTSLLSFAAARAGDCGIRLLRATGSQFEANISYAALHQLLHPCLNEVSHLSPLFAGALNVALDLGEGPPPAQLLVASAVLALLQQAAKEQPLLLIVDDLPWLDRASALVLGMVARRLDGPHRSALHPDHDLLLRRPRRLVAAPARRHRPPRTAPAGTPGPPSIPAAARRPLPTSPPPATAASTGFPPPAPSRPGQRGHHRAADRHRRPGTGNHRTRQRPLAVRPGPHPAHLRFASTPHQANDRRPAPPRRRHEIFHRLGATPWAARADRELRATGITVSTTDTGLAALTPQQRQIALLAVAGHTNKEIAARLFLSPRTVSTHLYQVFPKLGITSRAALRDALADTPLE